MKKINLIKKITLGVLALSLLATTGCGNSKTEESAEGGVKKITFAYRNTGNWPMTGDDEAGNPTGYDIDVLKLVDEQLADYEFEYVGTSYDDAYVGLESGTYDAALTNAFWTQERAEKYLIPEEALGASVLVLAVRKEDAAVKDFETLHDSGIKLAPILAGNGMFYVVKNYNEENPDKAIDITTTDDSTFVAGSIEELVAGKYDAVLWTKPQFDSTVVAEDGENHSLLDDISYSEFTTVNTYPMFSKNVGEDFVKAFSQALKNVKDSGKPSEISQSYFDYDIWNYDFK